MRWGALAIFAVGALAYIWRSLVPLVLRRINPVYAAHSIERTKPSLKNSLVNFLLLRANPAGLTQNVYEAIEEQAATGLAQVPADAAIDRSKLIRIGYLFLAVLLVSAIYKVVSPKDPLRTIGRVVLPWADIDPPTRVRIVAIRPENATVFRGQTVPVTVEVLGLSSGQPVTLDYTTADGQLVERAIEMHVPADGYAYACDLPEGKEGMQQDLAYRIVAGDAVSHTFHLTVEAAPTIVVESVDYRYPDYTGLVSQSTAHQADIKGIEGTAVTILRGGQSADQIGPHRFRLQQHRRPADDVRRPPGVGHVYAGTQGRSPHADAHELPVAVHECRRAGKHPADPPSDRGDAGRSA